VVRTAFGSHCHNIGLYSIETVLSFNEIAVDSAVYYMEDIDRYVVCNDSRRYNEF
jgi:hypothetical protein